MTKRCDKEKKRKVKLGRKGLLVYVFVHTYNILPFAINCHKKTKVYYKNCAS